MRKLAFGPVSDFPSWRWIGSDTGRELTKYFEVSYFDDIRRIPPCDAVAIVKRRLPLRFAGKLRDKGVKLIFLPVDLYAGHEEIHRDRQFLESCDLVLSHSDLLLRCLQPYCARVALVEHHGKYTLPMPAAYRPDGYVLWVGGLQYVPVLLDWLARHPLGREIKILTDSGNPDAIDAARRVARRLDLQLDLGPRSINGYEMHPWSEEAQLRMLQACKAAIDIKGDDFNQQTKPPTKAQKFVSSGIAFACNAESPASRYFRDRDFELACPLDEAWWFSEAYWQQTRRFAAELRERISIEAVGRHYRDELGQLWSTAD